MKWQDWEQGFPVKLPGSALVLGELGVVLTMPVLRRDKEKGSRQLELLILSKPYAKLWNKRRAEGK